jgi:hypothetical protein
MARFTTALTGDTEAPSFPGVVGLSWDLVREQDDCVDELTERFVFDIELGDAIDDGGPDGLTLLLFQTSGPEIDKMPMPLPGRAWPGTHTQVSRATEEAVGEICFGAIVRERPARSASGNVTACVHDRPTVLPRLQRRGRVRARMVSPGRWRPPQRRSRLTVAEALMVPCLSRRNSIRAVLVAAISIAASTKDRRVRPARRRARATARTWRRCVSAGTAAARGW